MLFQIKMTMMGQMNVSSQRVKILHECAHSTVKGNYDESYNGKKNKKRKQGKKEGIK